MLYSHVANSVELSFNSTQMNYVSAHSNNYCYLLPRLLSRRNGIGRPKNKEAIFECHCKWD